MLGLLGAVPPLDTLAEPRATAFVLTALGLLLGASVLLSRSVGRANLPVALLYLGIGMLAGSEGLGRIPFDDYGLAFRAGTASLVLILFDGGLNTPRAAFRRALAPAAALASVGVLITASIVAVFAHWFGLAWPTAALLGAVVSSTDAASVFSILRLSRIALERRVSSTLELESGLNDPMAVVLTVTMTDLLRTPHHALGWRVVGEIALEILIGLGLGVALGRLGRRLLKELRLPVPGLLPVLTVALALTAFGLPSMFGGSGFLAVYIAGATLAAEGLPLGSGLHRVHDALAWFCQVLMFLLLGLLSYPSRLLSTGWMGLGIGLSLAFVARPIAVAVCLLPFRYSAREVAYVGWVGLRGAVPIILATYPVLSHVDAARQVFDLVFFAVVVNSILPGATVRWVTQRLGLESRAAPPPDTILELSATRPLDGTLLSFHLDRAAAVIGAALADLPFPDDAAVVMIIRDNRLLAPRGASVCMAGDQVWVLCRPDQTADIRLLFGRPDQD